ncbi:sugar ABC transporter ATP-binding protein [Fodinicola acaciae]|uniref:sugar ABC transporter ATP-binding protein n=1 Tax=Fodinicola acaciae TaxID=2681555 RepID=UPI0013D14159|nr:sugar ABC transporter ATP-binding protein [Fodinicola acaciae]
MVVLAASGIVKRYGGVTALDNVDIRLRQGEVHGLVGENGAGKSTLVQVLCGVTRPDRGTIELDGEPVTFANARRAAANGVAIVSQELSLFPDLTVPENLFPHDLPVFLRPRRMERAARPVLDELGLDVPARARVGTLSLADQQLLEIARALLQNPRVLILDEPTSALPKESVDRLEAVIRTLAARGIAVLYISHFLEEVLRFADRITVFRDGHTVVDGAETGTVTLDNLVAAMLGGSVAAAEIVRSSKVGAVTVRFDHVSVSGYLDDISFTAAEGEIVGLAGLQGAGHLTALEVLCGRTAVTSGSVWPASRSLRAAVRSGVAFVSSDRKRYGLMMDKPVWQNVSAVSWLGIGRGGWWLNRGRLTRVATEHGQRLGIRATADAVTASLSGGNQQKVVFAKWLVADPSVIVLDDPTRGVDVGARAEMHAVTARLAADGKTVLLASSDLTELVELCQRVLVFQRGRLVDELAGQRLSEQELSVAMNAGFAS